jgi:hypothetical protein
VWRWRALLEAIKKRHPGATAIAAQQDADHCPLTQGRAHRGDGCPARGTGSQVDELTTAHAPHGDT